jgi:hypothetical protein
MPVSQPKKRHRVWRWDFMSENPASICIFTRSTSREILSKSPWKTSQPQLRIRLRSEDNCAYQDLQGTIGFTTDNGTYHLLEDRRRPPPNTSSITRQSIGLCASEMYSFTQMIHFWLQANVCMMHPTSVSRSGFLYHWAAQYAYPDRPRGLNTPHHAMLVGHEVVVEALLVTSLVDVDARDVPNMKPDMHNRRQTTSQIAASLPKAVQILDGGSLDRYLLFKHW